MRSIRHLVIRMPAFKGKIMSKKKYYAVKGGKSGDAIYETWSETEAMVKGVSKVKYKSFASLSEAQAFLEEAGSARPTAKGPANAGAKKTENPVPQGAGDLNQGLVAYVDGSFRQGHQAYGYGVVILKDGKIQDRLAGWGNEEDFVAMRNVAGEVTGAMKAIDYALEKGETDVLIVYDYQGVESWATGAWKRNNRLTQGYYEFVTERRQNINIRYKKVKGHSGDYYNDMADELAKQAVLEASMNP